MNQQTAIDNVRPADAIDYPPVVFMGCSSNEIIFLSMVLLVFGAAIWTLIFLLSQWGALVIIGMVLTFSLSFLLSMVTLSRFKQGKPRSYVQILLLCYLQRWRFIDVGLIQHHGYWCCRRGDS